MIIRLMILFIVQPSINSFDSRIFLFSKRILTSYTLCSNTLCSNTLCSGLDSTKEVLESVLRRVKGKTVPT